VERLNKTAFFDPPNSSFPIGIDAYPATVKPYISPRNAAKRVEWCEEHLSWIAKDWMKILWTDECSIEIRGSGSKRTLVWRTSGERLDPDCLMPSFKSGRVSIMFWGCYIGHKLGPLVVFPEGSINSERYCEVLTEYLLPFLRERRRGTLLMADNAPIHTSQYTCSWMDNHGVKSMEWPAQSPDLNPLENIWHELKVAVQKRIEGITGSIGREEFIAIVQEEWEKIGKKKSLENLIKSMPERMRLVIEAEGMPIDY
jgi:transposase